MFGNSSPLVMRKKMRKCSATALSFLLRVRPGNRETRQGSISAFHFPWQMEATHGNSTLIRNCRRVKTRGIGILEDENEGERKERNRSLANAKTNVEESLGNIGLLSFPRRKWILDVAISSSGSFPSADFDECLLMKLASWVLFNYDRNGH